MQEESASNAKICLTFPGKVDTLYLIVLSLLVPAPAGGEDASAGSMIFLFFLIRKGDWNDGFSGNVQEQADHRLSLIHI